MNVYLVQHAYAKSEQEDSERPLSEKGWADIRKIADFVFKKGNISVKEIFHSGKMRARQTAEVLAEKLNSIAKEADGLKPMDDPSIWAERLTKRKEDIMLVGHLPHLSRLASLLLCQNAEKTLVEFQQGCIVCIGTENFINWSIRWMVTPNLL
jgi:phosphohistidine phosphatase